MGGQEKEWMGCFLDELKAFGINVDQCTTHDYSPGRGGMAQNGGTWGGAFYGEMDRCRESQGSTTACSGMLNVTGRTKERIAQSKRTRAGSLALVD